jgi:NAD(P)-dependent dehydrogenase (short-subunit alcohol dehydrogenase family)
MRGLQGKRIIIGGGATGMGAALALRLVAEGAKVVVGDINEAGLKLLASEFHAGPGKGIVMVFDLADEASIRLLVRRCVEELGGIDGVAISGADLTKATLGNDRTVLDMDRKIWERTLQVNLIGHALLMRESIPHMIKAGGGSIVSISSADAYLGLDEVPAYSASKAGLHALVRHTARLVGKHNIRVNGVAPGLVLTEGAKVNLSKESLELVLNNITLTRLGETEDISSAMAFLLSDESAWITGQVLSVNGGMAFRD